MVKNTYFCEEETLLFEHNINDQKDAKANMMERIIKIAKPGL